MAEEYILMPLMTIPQAAAYLGVGRKMVYQLLEMGQIRAVRTNGTAMIEKQSLDDFRDSGKLT